MGFLTASCAKVLHTNITYLHNHKQSLPTMSKVDQGDPSLECGTSLAEYEHYPEEQQEDRRASSSAAENKVEPPASQQQQQQLLQEKDSSIAALRESLASDVVTEHGPYTTVVSPYGKLPLVYCDQTASNRPCRSMERYMERVCLPLYGNTHTNTSITGSQT